MLPARGISKPLASHQWSTVWGLGCYYTRPVCSAIQSNIAQNGLIAAAPIIANKMPPPMCRAACARLSKTGGGVRISSFGLVCIALFGLLGILAPVAGCGFGGALLPNCKQFTTLTVRCNILIKLSYESKMLCGSPDY